MGQTSLSQLPYPEATEQPFVHLDMKELADATDAKLYVECTSGTRPAHRGGRRIYETDTARTYVSDGTAWTAVVTNGPWSPLTITSGWAVVPGTQMPATRIEGDSVVLRAGRLRWAVGSAAVEAGVVVTPAAGIFTTHRAAVPEWIGSALFLSGGVPTLCTITAQGASLLVTPGVSGTLGSGDSSQLIIPTMRWPRP